MAEALNFSHILIEWSQQGMILRLPDYESGALTN